LPAYYSDRYSYPCVELSFQYSNDYLTKLSKAVSTLLANYYAATARAGLLTAPCRYRALLRRSAGSRSVVAQTTLMPNKRAPQLILREYDEKDGAVSAYVEIRNLPKRAYFRPTGSFATTAGGASPLSLEFYATAEGAMADASVTCSTPSNVDVDGIIAREIPYDRYQEEYIMRMVEADNSFSLVGSTLTTGLSTTTPTAVPLTTVALNGDDDGESLFTKSYLHVMTQPLDLGLPEQEKRVRGVTLRGIFPRDKVQMTLYGSHHREQWRKIATARGAHLRFLCGVRYRWLRVEIETPLRDGDKVDALTCVIKN
jgi:hypothetical protein